MARIVVIEDEADIVTLVTTKLRNGGHEVSVARDGERGLALVRDTRPDAVVLDVMMPGMDGFAVCRSIRADTSLPQPVVVLLSARSQKTDRERGFEAGCDDYIIKPFRPSQLLERLGELLQQRGSA